MPKKKWDGAITPSHSTRICLNPTGRTETALATHRIGELIRLHKISCEIRGDDHLRNAFAVLDGLRFCTLIVKGYQNFTAVVSIDDTDLVGPEPGRA